MDQSLSTLYMSKIMSYAITSHYSDLSLWDIHRTQTSLLTLLQPNVSLDIVKSLIRMYQDGGALPRWPIANGENG